MDASKRAERIRNAATGADYAKLFNRVQELRRAKRTGHQEQEYRQMVLELQEKTRERFTRCRAL